MVRFNVGMLARQEQTFLPKVLNTCGGVDAHDNQAENDILQASKYLQEIGNIQYAAQAAEEVIQEAEEERKALELSQAQNGYSPVAMEALQRTIKSFERRTGLQFKMRSAGIEALTKSSTQKDSVGFAMEGVIDYIKKLIKMLIDAIRSVWEKVKSFLKNVFSGADKLHKRAEKIKEAAGDESKEEYRRKSEIIDGIYYPSTLLKESVGEGKTISIRNALIMELNIKDAEAETLRAGLNWVLSEKPQTVQKYEEKEFAREIDNDKSKWDRQYYLMQEVYTSTNFSKERYLHMIEVREYLRNKGVKGFVKSTKNVGNEGLATSAEKTSTSGKISIPTVLEFVTLNGKVLSGGDFVDQYVKQTTSRQPYRESLDEYIKNIYSGEYTKILEAAKKDDNKEEIAKLIKGSVSELSSKAALLGDSKDNLLTYSNSSKPYLLGDYYEEFTSLKKDATWEQIANEYSRISADLVEAKNQKKVTEVTPLTRKEAGALASAAMAAMKNYKNLEDQQKKLDGGFNKILSEAKRLEKDESISGDQLRIATGFVRASLNATIKMLVAVNSYEIRLTKAALDYAAASIRE